MPDPVPDPSTLLAISPHRTLTAGSGSPPGSTTGNLEWVAKRFEAGPADEADREATWLRVAAGAGVVRLLERTTCPTTGHPLLVMSRAPGTDLASLLSGSGPLPLDLALDVAESLVATLLRLREQRSTDAPAGMFHGDVKPGNVLFDPTTRITTLIDFEHAGPAPVQPVAETPPSAGFTGGSHGYAPPEAYLGTAAGTAFDVFGLGCTLFEVITGRPAIRSRSPEVAAGARAADPEGPTGDGLPAQLRGLLADCLADAPERRPSLADLAERLTASRRSLQTSAAKQRESCRQAWLGGRLEAAETLATAAPTDREARAWQRRQRAGRRLHPLEPFREDTGLALEAELRLLQRTSQLEARRRWFPADPALLGARALHDQVLATWLEQVPAAVADAVDRGRPRAAQDLIDGLRRVLSLLGPPRPAAGDRAETVPPGRRAPLALLAALQQETDRSRRLVEDARQQLATTLERLDLDGARTKLDELTARHGGSIAWIAELRDRVLRFEFYAQRVGRQTGLVDELAALCDAHHIDAPLTAMLQLHRQLARIPAAEAAEDPVEVRPRPLLRAFRDLLREFPELSALVRPALDELQRCCLALTRRAWLLAADADRRLATPPIPIRPLEQSLGQLDALIHADVILDEEQRSRTGLIEEFESLRLRVDEARSARDRLAQGAQEAMDRGHLTTAIFDMERATDRFSDDDEASEAGGPSLAQQFEEARRRKQELEQALRRNHQLAARCARLLADATASPRARLDALEEREQVLADLCRSLPPDRRENHLSDLREVHVAMLRAIHADGAARIDRLEGAGERLQVAREVLDALQHCAPDQGWSAQDADEARNTLQHWLETVERETERSRGRRIRPAEPGIWRHLALPLALAITLATVVTLFVTRPWSDPARTPRFADRLLTALGDAATFQATAGTLRLDGEAARARFEAFAATLAEIDPMLANGARELSRTALDPDAPWSIFATGVTEIDQRAAGIEADPATARAWRRYLDRTLRLAFATRVEAATERGTADALLAALREHAGLRGALRIDEAELLASLLENR